MPIDVHSLINRRWLFLGTVVAAALAVTAVSVLSLLGDWIWPLDLLSHYRLQYAVLVFAAMLAAAVARSLAITGGLAALFALHLLPVVPLILPTTQPIGNGNSLRVIQANVLTSNDRVEETVAWLLAQDADVIVAQETDQRWADGLTTSLVGWKLLTTEAIRSDNFGMLVFVREGLGVGQVEIHYSGSLPSIAVELGFTNGPPVLLYAVHTLPPTSTDNVEVAQEQLDFAASILHGHEGPRIIVGDLNTTRWGSHYRRLRSRIDLKDSADGQGISGTWPSRLWFTGMIGIDHVLVSGDIRVDDRRIGPHLGSDHRAVVVDMVVVTP